MTDPDGEGNRRACLLYTSISNAKETRSRGARVLLFTTKDAVVPEGVADAVIRLDEYEDLSLIHI